MPYLFGWREPLIPNSGSASEGERPDCSNRPLPHPCLPPLKHLLLRKAFILLFSARHAELLWNTRSFSCRSNFRGSRMVKIGVVVNSIPFLILYSLNVIATATAAAATAAAGITTTTTTTGWGKPLDTENLQTFISSESG